MKVLVLNSGSSSQKSALFEIDRRSCGEAPEPLWQAKIEWSGPAPELVVNAASGGTIRDRANIVDRRGVIEHMLETLWAGKTRVLGSASEIDVVAHRVVHGGPHLTDPIEITPAVKSTLAHAGAFAPLHSRSELEGIELVDRLLPRVPQVAVFDTGFHRTLPRRAAQYPGPYDWFEEGIRRYGFHGINHQYCAQRAARLLDLRLESLKIVSCHLGNGCSLAAIQGGESVDTTMGFTPLEGLMMGTRSGSIDPGILTYLVRETSMSGEDLDAMLNRQAGLLAISGLSADMRDIESGITKGNTRAQLAFDMFVHHLHKNIAAMASVLGGVDVLTFTAGIGENSAKVRSAACAQLSFMGVKLDADKNSRLRLEGEISSFDSKVRILVIRAQEDWAIAQASLRIIEHSRRGQGKSFFT
ncbi:MAG: acetate kinase [Acidobacteria bacterium]|nr:acetate kinase [Acidobacteriota bacterium]